MPHVTTRFENNKKKLKMHRDQPLPRNRKKNKMNDSKIPNEDLMAEEQAEMKAQEKYSEHSQGKTSEKHSEKKHHGHKSTKKHESSEEMDQSHSAYEASGVEHDEKESSFSEEEFEASSEEMENPKVHLEFYGSEYIRMKAPDVMNFAESVVGEWQQDGDFERLPVDNHMAQLVAAKALRKAKDLEKTLDEKGVFAMARMGVDYVKSKIEKKEN